MKLEDKLACHWIGEGLGWETIHPFKNYGLIVRFG